MKAKRVKRKTSSYRKAAAPNPHAMDVDIDALIAEESAKDPVFAAASKRIAAEYKIAAELVAIRKAAGLTQAALAKRMGVKQPAVARLEVRGYARYTYQTVSRYINACGGTVGFVAHFPDGRDVQL